MGRCASYSNLTSSYVSFIVQFGRSSHLVILCALAILFNQNICVWLITWSKIFTAQAKEKQKLFMLRWERKTEEIAKSIKLKIDWRFGLLRYDLKLFLVWFFLFSILFCCSFPFRGAFVCIFDLTPFHRLLSMEIDSLHRSIWRSNIE